MPDQKALEAEMEQTRQQLASNIDQLVYRAKPGTIIKRQTAALKAYFVDQSGSPRTDNIAKVAGGVVGAVAVVLVLRRVTR